MSDYDIYAYFGVISSIVCLVFSLYVLMLEFIAWCRVTGKTESGESRITTRRQVYFKFVSQMSYLAAWIAIACVFYDTGEHLLFKKDGPFPESNYGFQAHWIGHVVVSFLACTRYAAYAFRWWGYSVRGAAKPKGNTQALASLAWITQAGITAVAIAGIVYAWNHVDDTSSGQWTNGSLNALAIQSLLPVSVALTEFLMLFDSIRQMNFEKKEQQPLSRFQIHDLVRFAIIATASGVDIAIAAKFQGFNTRIATTDSFSSNEAFKYLFVDLVLAMADVFFMTYDRACVLIVQFGARSLLGKPRDLSAANEYAAVSTGAGKEVEGSTVADIAKLSVGAISSAWSRFSNTGRKTDLVTYTRK